jgi:hypothetical protein
MRALRLGSSAARAANIWMTGSVPELSSLAGGAGVEAGVLGVGLGRGAGAGDVATFEPLAFELADSLALKALPTAGTSVAGLGNAWLGGCPVEAGRVEMFCVLGAATGGGACVIDGDGDGAGAGAGACIDTGGGAGASGWL